MCPEGFVLGPDWKNCDDVDECATGDYDNDNVVDEDNDNEVNNNDEGATGDCHHSL